MTAQETEKDEVDGSPSSNPMRIAIPLGVALIVGLLTAIGIDGEARDRLIRNAPEAIFGALTLAVLGVGLPILVSQVLPHVPANWKRHKGLTITGGVIAFLSAVLLLSGSIFALYTGTSGLAERENPSLSLSAARVPGGTDITVTVTATAPSLASYEKMLLRVVSVEHGVEAAQLAVMCNNPNLEAMSGSSVLHWAETGPTRAGTAESSVTVKLSPEVSSHACAYVALFDKDPDSEADDRRAWGVLATASAPVTE